MRSSRYNSEFYAKLHPLHQPVKIAIILIGHPHELYLRNPPNRIFNHNSHLNDDKRSFQIASTYSIKSTTWTLHFYKIKNPPSRLVPSAPLPIFSHANLTETGRPARPLAIPDATFAGDSLIIPRTSRNPGDAEGHKLVHTIIAFQIFALIKSPPLPNDTSPSKSRTSKRGFERLCRITIFHGQC